MRYALIGLWLVFGGALAQPDPFPKVASSYLVKLNGELLWERQINRKLAPASLTKLMTALLALDDYQPQGIVKVSREAAQETGMRLGLKQGQSFFVKDLLASALISSDNDACHALADFVGGDEKQFVLKMNQRAKQLGMHNTHFTNACGHDAREHYSTAQDLLLLAEEILKHPEILSLVSRDTSSIATADGSKTYQLITKNALIGRYPGALGLKTGYTPKAGKCLIAYAVRGSVKVLLVMLHGNDRWWDAADMLDIAFAQVAHAS